VKVHDVVKVSLQNATSEHSPALQEAALLPDGLNIDFDVVQSSPVSIRGEDRKLETQRECYAGPVTERQPQISRDRSQLSDDERVFGRDRNNFEQPME
jgi:hypothetical protein